MGRKSGTQARNNQQPPKDWNAAQREEQVAALRLKGMEFAEIARQTGYANHSGAFKAWKRYLSRLPVVETEQARKNAELRLNELLAAIWDKAKGGDMWAIDRALAIEKRRSELLGLDKQKEAINRPTDEVRREYVGVNLADLLNHAGQTVSANGSGAYPLQN